MFYGGSGVCRIDGVISREFGDEMRDYYVLTPVHSQSSTVYLPVDNNNLVSRMREVLSKEEIYQLIHMLPAGKDLWIENENLRKTAEENRVSAETDRSNAEQRRDDPDCPGGEPFRQQKDRHIAVSGTEKHPVPALQQAVARVDRHEQYAPLWNRAERPVIVSAPCAGAAGCPARGNVKLYQL